MMKDQGSGLMKRTDRIDDGESPWGTLQCRSKHAR